MYVVSSDEMQALERQFMNDTGITSVQLMERAAKRLMRAAQNLLNGDIRGKSVAVFCGPGANGGDGWAVAWKLADAGANVCAIAVSAPQNGAAVINYEKCKSCVSSMDIILTCDAEPAHVNEYLRERVNFEGVELCIDALFGTGLSRGLTGVYMDLVDVMRLMRAAGAKVLAVDIPSGLDGNTGAILSDRICEADMTVTFQFIKRGQLFGDGQDVCGKLQCCDIGIHEKYAPDGAPIYVSGDYAQLPRRRHNSHKGTYGHALIIAGSEMYAGAALMCVKSAVRAGAGLVTAACVDYLRPLIQITIPSAMALGLTSSSVFNGAAAARLEDVIVGKSSICIGPGITRQASPDLIYCVLKSGLPAVIDADALNIMAASDELLSLLGPHHVLTPHPGEMMRLIKRNIDSPIDDARALAEKYNCTVLLKGCATCVSDGVNTFVMNPGAAGMATGGSGDVLAGVITALLAQGIEPVRAAVYGALLHGSAGRLAQDRLGAYSMCATDIIDFLPQAFIERQIMIDC